MMYKLTDKIACHFSVLCEKNRIDFHYLVAHEIFYTHLGNTLQQGSVCLHYLKPIINMMIIILLPT